MSEMRAHEQATALASRLTVAHDGYRQAKERGDTEAMARCTQQFAEATGDIAAIITPPTVVQPPVAEGEYLRLSYADAAEILYANGSPVAYPEDFGAYGKALGNLLDQWEAEIPEGRKQQLIDAADANDVMEKRMGDTGDPRRLAQARSAPPSEGIDRFIQPIHESVMYSIRSVLSMDTDEDNERLSDIVNDAIAHALAAPSGGPDVE